MGLKTLLARFAQFFGELKRRHVFRVAAGYALSAWLLIEVASVILPAFSAPDWILQAFIIVAAAGGIVVLIVAWIFDLTQDGFVRTEPLRTEQQEPEDSGETGAVEKASEVPAERRPVTVLRFKIDSLAAAQSDAGAEQFYELLPRVQNVFDSIIRRYDGHQVRIGADEANVFFGIPLAHEHDAQRALRCALSLRDSVAHLNNNCELSGAERLRFSAGLDSGTVVAGTGAGDCVAVVGLPVRGAQQLAARAQAGEMLASQRTLERGGGHFETSALVAPGNRRDDSGETIYKVHRQAGAARSSDASDMRRSTPLVGRAAELSLLESRCRRAFAGDGQVILICGEPGIGKSRLAGELAKMATGFPGVWTIEIACQSRRQGEAWHPVKQLLRKTVLFDVDDDDALGMQQRLKGFVAQHAFDTDIVLPLLCDLLDIPSEVPVQSLNLSAERLNQQLFEFLLTALLHRAGSQPVLLIGEDVQWADPTTLEFLRAAARQVPSLPMLIGLTYRNGFDPALKAAGHISAINLSRLSQEEVKTLIENLSGNCEAVQELSAQIFGKSDGVPLFAEELARTVIAEGRDTDGTGTKSTLNQNPALPATLQESLMWRLDQFDSARSALRVAAVLGREFDFATLAAAGQFTHHDSLRADLDRMIDGELLLQRGFGTRATYRFRHALLQEAAYGLLLRKDRESLHDRIAAVLPALNPRLKDENPEFIAIHLERGKQPAQAAAYWDLAGQREARRCANAEAVSNFERALACLATDAGSAGNNQQTLAILMRLGPAMMALRGYSASAVEALYQRAQELSESVSEPASLAAALFGQWAYQVVRGNTAKAADRAERLLSLALEVQDQDLALEAHQALGVTGFHAGKLASSVEHLQAVIEVYDPQRHAQHAYVFGQDPGVASHAYLANALWCGGKPELAVKASKTAVRMADQSNHPHSHAFALLFVARFHQHRGDREKTLELAERAQAICEENILPVWDAFAKMLAGWAKAVPGRYAEALTSLETGLNICHHVGVGISVPYYQALMGQIQAMQGDADAGIATMDQAIAAASQAGGTIELPEMMRIRALALTQIEPANPAIDASLREAMALATSQGAWAWQLRIANDIAARLVAASQDRDAAALLRGALEKCDYREAEADHQKAGELIARCAA